ncbi:hypothetical protein LEMLEM_LOCUS14162, partial [Lemmus lemmus]
FRNLDLGPHVCKGGAPLTESLLDSYFFRPVTHCFENAPFCLALQCWLLLLTVRRGLVCTPALTWVNPSDLGFTHSPALELKSNTPHYSLA